MKFHQGSSSSTSNCKSRSNTSPSGSLNADLDELSKGLKAEVLAAPPNGDTGLVLDTSIQNQTSLEGVHKRGLPVGFVGVLSCGSSVG